jgi:hypothetical protein
MSIEVDCCCPKRRTDNRVVKSSVISAGDWAGVSLLEGRIRIAIFNNLDGDKGSILISGKTKKVRAVVYEDEYDREGTRVDQNKPIIVRGKQRASIETKKCKPNSQVLVYSANFLG